MFKSGINPKLKNRTKPGAKPEHEQYLKYLEQLCKYAYDEYKHLSADLGRIQLDYIKNYLWVSSVLAAAEISFFLDLMSGVRYQSIVFFHKQLSPSFYFFSVFAVFLSICCFAIGIDTLRGRSSQIMPFGDFTKLAELAYDDMKSKYNGSFYSTLVRSLDDVVHGLIAQRNSVGLRLRFMCYMILSSLLFAVIAFTAMLVVKK